MIYGMLVFMLRHSGRHCDMCLSKNNYRAIPRFHDVPGARSQLRIDLISQKAHGCGVM